MKEKISLEEFNKDAEEAQKNYETKKPKTKRNVKVKFSEIQKWWENTTNLQVYVGDVYDNGVKRHENGQRTLILSNKKVTQQIVFSTDYMKKTFGEEKCFIYKNARSNKIEISKARNIKELHGVIKQKSYEAGYWGWHNDEVEILGWVDEEELKSIANKMNKELSYER